MNTQVFERVQNLQLNSQEFSYNNKQNSFNLKDYLIQKRIQVKAALEQSITITHPEKIYQAMRYFLLAPGKRLRPIVCLASCEFSGGTAEMAMPTACAIEMVHTVSLIRDALLVTDNDGYRSERVINHNVWGEDIAILAGDALLAYAFEFLVEQTKNIPPNQILSVVAKLSHAVAATGLIGGQVLDLELIGQQNVDVETLKFIHIQKTGALLEASAVCGAILAGANQELLHKLSFYARNIGLAFQIVDDILDITATTEELGKIVRKDLQAQKATYSSIWGIEESMYQAQRLVDEAKAQLIDFEEKAFPLIALADYITTRNQLITYIY